jgi:hypothetical protein
MVCDAGAPAPCCATNVSPGDVGGVKLIEVQFTQVAEMVPLMLMVVGSPTPVLQRPLERQVYTT